LAYSQGYILTFKSSRNISPNAVARQDFPGICEFYLQYMAMAQRRLSVREIVRHVAQRDRALRIADFI
jgi:hypothetical protein